MISYILAANSELNTGPTDRLCSLEAEGIMERLGSQATEDDAVQFSKLWKARFLSWTVDGFDDGIPVFYDQEDFDRSWSELLEIMG